MNLFSSVFIPACFKTSIITLKQQPNIIKLIIKQLSVLMRSAHSCIWIFKTLSKVRGFLIIPFFQKTNIMNEMQGINFSE